MTRNRIALVAPLILALVGGLGLLRFAVLRRGGGAEGGDAARRHLGVGFLPVT